MIFALALPNLGLLPAELDALIVGVFGGLLPLLGQKLQRCGVDLKSLAEGGGTVSEDVAQVCLTVGAHTALDRCAILQDWVHMRVGYLGELKEIISERD